MHSYAVNNVAAAAVASAMASSNNSINENRYNSEKLAKASAIYKLKKILKPIVTLLKNKKSQQKHIATSSPVVSRRHQITSYIDEFDCDYDNAANERLEAQLISELEQCHHQNAAILVYEDQQLQVLPIEPEEEQYVPVHFARTEAGTFFWTTAMPRDVLREVDEDLIQPAHCYTEQQCAQQAYADRWAQA